MWGGYSPGYLQSSIGSTGTLPGASLLSVGAESLNSRAALTQNSEFTHVRGSHASQSRAVSANQRLQM